MDDKKVIYADFCVAYRRLNKLIDNLNTQEMGVYDAQEELIEAMTFLTSGLSRYEKYFAPLDD